MYMYMHTFGYQCKNWYHHSNTFLALLQRRLIYLCVCRYKVIDAVVHTILTYTLTPSHPHTPHPHTWFALHSKLKASSWLEESNFPFCRLRGGGDGRCEGCACRVNKLEGAVFQSLHPCTVQCPRKGFLTHIGQLYHLKRIGERQRLISLIPWSSPCTVLLYNGENLSLL